jgi:hypothetical protein
VDSWPFCGESWLQSILPPAISARLLSFDYKIEISREFSWMRFIEEGEQLLLALSKSRTEVSQEIPELNVTVTDF